MKIGMFRTFLFTQHSIREYVINASVNSDVDIDLFAVTYSVTHPVDGHTSSPFAKRSIQVTYH